MTDDETNQESEGKRRFDDVAKLFGGIVPPAGTPVPPRPAFRRAPTIEEPVTSGRGAPAQFVPPPRPTPPPELVAAAARAQPKSEPELPPGDKSEAQVAPMPRGGARASPSPQSWAPPADPPPRPPRGARPVKQPPWPDAFATERDRRVAATRGGRSGKAWLWLLIVPLVVAVAIGAYVVDPTNIRLFVETHFPNLKRPDIDSVVSLLPAPFRPSGERPPADSPATASAPPSNPPAAQQSSETPPPSPGGNGPGLEGAPSTPSPAAPPSTAAPPAAQASPLDAPIPAPTAAVTAQPSLPQPSAPIPGSPTSGSPTASQAPSAAAPVDTSERATPSAALPSAPIPPIPPADAPPAQTSAPATSSGPDATPQAAVSGEASLPKAARLVIHYRPHSGVADSDARRVALQAASLAREIELRAGTTTYRSPTIVYYNPADRSLADRVARGLGGGIAVRAGPGRSETGTLDIWLP